VDEEVIKDIGNSVRDMLLIRVSATDLSKFNTRLVDSSASIKKSSTLIEEVIRDIKAEKLAGLYKEDVIKDTNLQAVRIDETETPKVGINILGLIGDLAGAITFAGFLFSDKIRDTLVPFLEGMITNLGLSTEMLEVMAPILKVASGLLSAFFTYRAIRKILDIFMLVGRISELIAVAGSFIDLEKSEINLERKKGIEARNEVRKRRKEIVAQKKNLKSKNWFTRTYARFKLAIPVIKKVGQRILNIVGRIAPWAIVGMTIYEVYELINELVTEYKAYQAADTPDQFLDNQDKAPELTGAEMGFLNKFIGREVIYDKSGRAVSLKELPEPPKPKPIEIVDPIKDVAANKVSEVIAQSSEMVVDAKKKAISITAITINKFNNSSTLIQDSGSVISGETAPYSTSIGR
jgi:hypothetical protein